MPHLGTMLQSGLKLEEKYGLHAAHQALLPPGDRNARSVKAPMRTDTSGWNAVVPAVAPSLFEARLLGELSAVLHNAWRPPGICRGAEASLRQHRGESRYCDQGLLVTPPLEGPSTWLGYGWGEETQGHLHRLNRFCSSRAAQAAKRRPASSTRTTPATSNGPASLVFFLDVGGEDVHFRGFRDSHQAASEGIAPAICQAPPH